MKTGTWRNANSQRGVTLAELLIVLAIMALMTTISVIAFRGPSDQMILQQSADRVVADLRRVAALSRQRGEMAEVTFHSEGYEAPILDENMRSMPRKVEFLLEEPLTIEFHPDGYSPGGEIPLHFDDRVMQILIHPYSGRVRVVS